ncbi:hypothetical protein Tco_0971316 [Tanacetum coccineum]
MSSGSLSVDRVEDSDDEEDEEIEESMDSNSVTEDAEDNGPTIDDGRIQMREDEGLLRGSIRARHGCRLVSAPLGLGYGALRSRELALEEGDVYSMFEVRHGSGPALESEIPEMVSAFRQPTFTTWTDLEDATPATAETEGFLTELGAQVEMQGGLISDHAV